MHDAKMICKSECFLCCRLGTKTSVMTVQFQERGKKKNLEEKYFC